MPWTLDKSRARYVRDLNKTEQTKFDTFQNGIANQGLHPRDAASRAGETKYERLGDTLFQIRLSKGSRATFTVDEGTRVCTIRDVGGHT